MDTSHEHNVGRFWKPRLDATETTSDERAPTLYVRALRLAMLTVSAPSQFDQTKKLWSSTSDHSAATEEPAPSVTPPPDVGACHHRVVRRHTTCFSPVTRRSMRACGGGGETANMLEG